MKAAVFWPVTSGDGIWSRAEEAGSLYHKKKSHETWEECKARCVFHYIYRNAVYFDHFLDGLGTAARKFKDSSLNPRVTLWNNNWLQSTLDQNHSVENCFLSNEKKTLASFGFEWAQNIEILAWKSPAFGLH